MSDLTISVFPGEIVIESISLLYDGPEAKILEIDFASKRPEVGMQGGWEGGVSVRFYASAETLHTDGAMKGRQTEVNIYPFDAREWFHDARASRYTGHIFIWRRGLADRARVLYARERPILDAEPLLGVPSERDGASKE